MYQDAPDIVTDIVLQLPEDQRQHVLILSPSVNQRSPVRGVAEALTKAGVQLHVCRSGDIATKSATSESMDNFPCNMLAQNKVQIKTFFAAKGLEARIVIVINTCQLFCDDTDEDEGGDIENQLYVALTRASQQLVVLHDYRKTCPSDLQTLQNGLCSNDAAVTVYRNLPSNRKKQRKSKSKPKLMTSGSMVSFLDSAFVPMLMQHTSQTTSVPPPKQLTEGVTDPDGNHFLPLPAPKVIQSFDQGKTYMDVGPLVDIAIVLALEYETSGRQIPQGIKNIHAQLLQTNLGLQSNSRYHNVRHRVMRHCEALRFQQCTEKELWRFGDLAVALDAHSSGYIEQLAQVRSTQFMNQPNIFFRLRTILQTVQNICADSCHQGLVWNPQLRKVMHVLNQPTIKTNHCAYAYNPQRKDIPLMFFVVGGHTRQEHIIHAAICAWCADVQSTVVININDCSSVATTYSEDIVRDAILAKVDPHSLNVHDKDDQDNMEDDQEFCKLYQDMCRELIADRFMQDVSNGY